MIDKEKGNLVKADRFKYAKRTRFGYRFGEIYGRELVDLRNQSRWETLKRLETFRVEQELGLGFESVRCRRPSLLVRWLERFEPQKLTSAFAFVALLQSLFLASPFAELRTYRSLTVVDFESEIRVHRLSKTRKNSEIVTETIVSALLKLAFAAKGSTIKYSPVINGTSPPTPIFLRSLKVTEEAEIEEEEENSGHSEKDSGEIVEEESGETLEEDGELKPMKDYMDLFSQTKKPSVALYIGGLYVCGKVGLESVMKMGVETRELFFYETFLYYNSLLLIQSFIQDQIILVTKRYGSRDYSDNPFQYLLHVVSLLFLWTFWRIHFLVHAVTFSDFFLADIMTSMSKVLSDLECLVCRMVHGQALLNIKVLKEDLKNNTQRFQQSSDAAKVVVAILEFWCCWKNPKVESLVTRLVISPGPKPHHVI
ncbi:hypothetical protein AXX17_AT2G07800 [Arabidopsis thaliana]|uniref:EXS domain-containing protein n=1 Tax=Arabidopsis thaliana TaxID=3702 RepID=A0A178VP69_ARATH|nr:hypothetical protein AXX17_AT2G07800 [Arabidopsis thaliana]